MRFSFDDVARRKRLAENSGTSGETRMGLQLANSLRISNQMVPQLHDAIKRVAEKLGITETIHGFVYASSEVNASVSQERDSSVVLAISSAAVKSLSAPELEFVIGHEMGHIIYEHLVAPVHYSPADPAEDFLELQRAAEISADRAGYMQVESVSVAVSAMAKMASGLDGELQFDLAAYIRQVRDLKANPAVGVAGSTHPPLPIRARALLGLETNTAVIDGKVLGDRVRQLDTQIERDLLLATYGLGGPPAAKNLAFWKAVQLFISDGSFTKAEQQWVSDNFGARRLESLLVMLNESGRSEAHDSIVAKIREHQAALDVATPATKREFERLMANLHRFQSTAT